MIIGIIVGIIVAIAIGTISCLVFVKKGSRDISTARPQSFENPLYDVTNVDTKRPVFDHHAVEIENPVYANVEEDPSVEGEGYMDVPPTTDDDDLYDEIPSVEGVGYMDVQPTTDDDLYDEIKDQPGNGYMDVNPFDSDEELEC